MLWCVQCVSECKDEHEARQEFNAQIEQMGFLGGRVLPPGDGKPWRVQVFFKDTSAEAGFREGKWLPDGMRYVCVMPNQFKAMGIMPESIIVTDNCIVEYDPKHNHLTIGNDLHMNGLDAPATLSSCEDVMKLIAVLQQITFPLPTKSR